MRPTLLLAAMLGLGVILRVFGFRLWLWFITNDECPCKPTLKDFPDGHEWEADSHE